MINVSWGWRSAMRTTCADRPLIRNMMGSPAFSAAGQNQSALPSVGHPSTRTPSIPGCSFHFGRSAADRGFSGMRPHDGEAIRVSISRFKTIIVAVAGPVRRDDDGAIDAGLVH